MSSIEFDAPGRLQAELGVAIVIPRATLHIKRTKVTPASSVFTAYRSFKHITIWDQPHPLYRHHNFALACAFWLAKWPGVLILSAAKEVLGNADLNDRLL